MAACLAAALLIAAGAGKPAGETVTPSPSSETQPTPKPTPPPAPAAAGEKSRDAGSASRRALLVGVTKYPNLAEKLQLVGPANDVILMRTTLVKHFGFADENIVTLSEADGAKDPARLPTRANIERMTQAKTAGGQGSAQSHRAFHPGSVGGTAPSLVPPYARRPAVRPPTPTRTRRPTTGRRSATAPRWASPRSSPPSGTSHRLRPSPPTRLRCTTSTRPTARRSW